MKDKHIKMSELADALKVNRSVVSTWKNRKTDPPIEYMDCICKFLGVSYHYFLTGVEENENNNIYTYKMDDTFNKINIVTEKTLLENYYKLDKKHRDKILNRIENYLDDCDEDLNIENEFLNESYTQYDIEILPKRIKTMSNIRDISVEEIFEACKLDKSIALNSDKYRTITACELAKIADFLNCSLDFLLGISENPSINKAPDETTILKMEIESLYNELAEKNKPEAKKIAEALYNKSAKRYKKNKIN